MSCDPELRDRRKGARPGGSLVACLFAPEHGDALVKVGCFPKRDEDINDAETRYRTAEPVRRDSLLKDRKTCPIGHKYEQVVLAPIAEQGVPRREDQIEPEQKAENNKKNDGQFFNHTADYNAFEFWEQPTLSAHGNVLYPFADIAKIDIFRVNLLKVSARVLHVAVGLIRRSKLIPDTLFLFVAKPRRLECS